AQIPAGERERAIYLQRPPECCRRFLVIELVEQSDADVVRAVSIFSQGLRGRILVSRWMSIAGKQTGSDNKRAHEENKTRSHIELIAPYTKCIGNAVDVVEPRCDKPDLQDSFVVEAHGAR